ncbi:MAG: penicillin-binding protein 2 [Synechococcaceae cyanobacterium RL_1_2]|nr:penicillin-binding protein 2 [Synechococcaceae cyanobacterium RL_1_2]
MTLLPFRPRDRQTKTDRNVGNRSQPYLLVFFMTLAILGAMGSRLFYLQIVKGKEYQIRADSNRIRLIPKKPIRGNIFDRNGQILATSRLAYSAFIWPIAKSKPQWPKVREQLAEILEMEPQDIEKELEGVGADSPTLIRLAQDLTPAQITALEEFHQELDSVEVNIEPIRDYPNKSLGAHVLGYTGELSEEGLEERKNDGYRLGDIVGKIGIESYFESDLRGEWGGQRVEVNGAGKIVRLLEEQTPKAGQDINLTLDSDLQKAAQNIISRKGRSGIVALDPETGEVLALASNPTFDPNIFSRPIKQEEWDRLNSTGNPFINRAVRGFPPASTFKVVTAVAGMETGKYPASTVLGTYPYLSAGGVRFHEWNKAGFGPMGYVGALQWSSNTFFAQVGRGIGGENLIKWSREFGFGEKSGIEIHEERAGLIADNEWKMERFDREWAVGDTINMSIGQGFTLANTVQVARMFAVIANDGYLIRPHLQ